MGNNPLCRKSSGPDGSCKSFLHVRNEKQWAIISQISGRNGFKRHIDVLIAGTGEV